MFYSHELLQDTKHGVSTIWLVANTGDTPNPASHKVTRRAIDNVDLRQAIQKISEPGAPLALRVQSNLLFGLSKVYEHKTRYILSDLEKIKGYLRELDRQRARKTTDPRAGRINPERLLLPDDPAFDAEQDYINFERGLNHNFADILDQVTNRTSSARMSPSTRSRHSSRFGSVSLDLGNEAAPSFQLSPREASLPASAHKSSYGNSSLFGGDADELGVMDLGIEFNGDGEEVPVGTNAAASAKAAKEAAAVAAAWLGIPQRVLPMYDPPTIYDVPEQEPPMQPFIPVADPWADELAGEPIGPDGEARPKISEKERRRRQRLVAKMVDNDGTQLPLSTFRGPEGWTRYEMDRDAGWEARVQKARRDAGSKYGRNAVFGTGIGGCGDWWREDLQNKEDDPLISLFSGKNLEMTTMRARARLNKAHRRDVGEAFGDDAKEGADAAYKEERARAKRGRETPKPTTGAVGAPEADMGLVAETALGDGMERLGLFASEPELGREEPLLLGDDRRLSSVVPWSKGPRSVVGSAQKLPGASRIMSSPRPSHRNSAIDFADRFNDSSLSMSTAATGGAVSGSAASGGWGRAGNAPSQPAGKPSDAPKEEFLEFVKNRVEEQTPKDEAAVVAAAAGPASRQWIGFEEVVPPQETSKSVAAQAFFHTLGLATEGRIKVLQEEPEEGEAVGKIHLGV